MMKSILAAVAVIFAIFAGSAQTHENMVSNTQPATDEQKSIRFAWGADLNSSIDLSQNDMSNIGIDAYFGVSLPAVEMLGVGVGANVPVSNSRYSYPLFAIVRTNFSTRPTLCFLDLRTGLSVNNRIDSHEQVGTYINAGVGIQLASTRSFRSHLILGYTFTSQGDFHKEGSENEASAIIRGHDLHFATLRLGITF